MTSPLLRRQRDRRSRRNLTNLILVLDTGWFSPRCSCARTILVTFVCICVFFVIRVRAEVARHGVVVSGVRRMNEVNARRARLVPGWVTVFGRVPYRYVTSQLGQLSLASLRGRLIEYQLRGLG